MYKNNLVTIICNGQVEKMLREEAIQKYLTCMTWSEGTEKERYANIISDLVADNDVCSDNLKH